MSCPHCAATAAFHGTTVHIWPPEPHTLGKLEKTLRRAGIDALISTNVDICVPDADHGALVRYLADVMSEPERRDSRVLVTQGEEVTAAHIPRVMTVESYIASVNGAWLEAILEESRLSFVFQPIIDAARVVHGHEALVRAVNADGSPISPAELFAAAATPSLLATLDRQARLGAVACMPAMPPGTRMFINFMPSTIYDPNYCLRSTTQAVERIGLDGSHVVFEVVESDQTRDGAHLKHIVDFYRAHGYRIALDDFGTGYNNLSTLLDFSPDYIKVDKDITRRLTADNGSRKLVQDLVGNANAQDTLVIAEGIETEVEFEICRDLGVQLFQGFHFARPAAAFHAALTA
jgi:EAL domain-containing protein (putative c-di-GMP-specific phosphodiesterase class I)